MTNYQHTDNTPCAGPILCAFRDSPGHESIYRDDLMEPIIDAHRIEHLTRDASSAQQLLAFKLLHRAVGLLTEVKVAALPANTRDWAIWEQHARALLRTLNVEPAGEMPAIPDPPDPWPLEPLKVKQHPRHAVHRVEGMPLRSHLALYHGMSFPSATSDPVIRERHANDHAKWQIR